jgi:hypothetical protein
MDWDRRDNEHFRIAQIRDRHMLVKSTPSYTACKFFAEAHAAATPSVSAVSPRVLSSARVTGVGSGLVCDGRMLEAILRHAVGTQPDDIPAVMSPEAKKTCIGRLPTPNLRTSGVYDGPTKVTPELVVLHTYKPDHLRFLHPLMVPP